MDQDHSSSPNQTRNNRTTALVVSAIVLLFSIPLNWIHLNKPTFTGSDGTQIPYPFASSLTATGWTGNLSLAGLSIPIWLAIAVGVLAVILALLNQRRVCSLPRLSLIVPGAACAACLVGTLALGLFSDDVTLGAGPWVACGGLLLGSVVAIEDHRRPA